MSGVRLALVLALATALSGCATWSRIDPASQVHARSQDYTVELPLGWVRSQVDTNDVFITRDGPALNVITVSRQPHDRKLPRTRRGTTPTMLPFELAELALAEWKNTEATANLEVLSNVPATVGGKPAVRVHIRYRNERGLPIERVLVALVDPRGRLAFVYEAPAIVYFQRSLPDFERMLASVRFPPAQ